MKTMRSTDGKRIWRTNDKRASELYHNGEANYAPKEEWKKEVRDLGNVIPPHKPKGLTSKDKWNKPSKAQKRQMRKTL